MEKKRCAILIILIFLLFNLLLQSEKSALLSSVQNPEKNIKGESVPPSWSESFAESSMPIVRWNRTYGGADIDCAYSVVQTSDDGFILAGYTYSFGAGSSDFWFVKTDYWGNAQWNKTYGGLGNDEAHSITRTLDGGYAILGTTDSIGAGGSDFWLVKTDSSGTMLWNKTYGGTKSDDAWSIVETLAGDFVLTGWTNSFEDVSGDFWLVKTGSYGDVLWNKTYGGTLLDAANSVQQTSDGGYVLAGYTYSFGAGGSDFLLVKTDAAGNEQWNKTYGGTGEDYGFSVVQTLDGGYALAGSTSSFGAGVYDFWLVKTDQFGNAMWNKTYGGIAYDEARSILQMANQGFVLAGWTESFGAGSSDCWLFATDALGNVQSSLTWGGIGYDYAYLSVLCNGGNVILVGETQSFGAGSSDFLLIRIWEVVNVTESYGGGGSAMKFLQ